MSLIKTQGFDSSKINSYSLNRKANGTFQLIIFFGGKKTLKGEKRWPDIPIGKSMETALEVVQAVEKIMVENEEFDIKAGIVLETESSSVWN